LLTAYAAGNYHQRFMLLSHNAETQTPRTHSLRPCAFKDLAIAFVTLLSLLLNTSCAAGKMESAAQQNSETRARRTGANNQTSEKTNAKDAAGKTEMPDINAQGKNNADSPDFYTALNQALQARGLKLENVCDESDPVSRRVLEDYGAMFVADESVQPPPVCMFTNETDVLKFQTAAKSKAAVIGGARIELQPAAMDALLAAREEAHQAGLDITPRGGTEAARRSYEDTLRLWDSRFIPALAHWNKLGRLSKDQVEHLRSLPIRDQVREVLELEKQGIFFSKDFSKSILYSIAAPGSSQHIAMLALDVEQFTDERVRRILARHGWFQTVKSDMPHFTYLGLAEKDLSSRGLRSMLVGKQLFWIPNVHAE
jgi:hypothetical protein